MVPTELLGDANGLFSSLSQGMRVIGPVAGAAIYTSAGADAVALVNTATFAVSAASYALLRGVPDLPKQAGAARPRFLVEIAAGVRHIAGSPVIRRLIIASAIAFGGAGMVNVAMFALVDDGLHRAPAIIGVLGGVQGAGSVVAGLCVGPMLRRIGEYATASTGFVLNGAGLALASTATFGAVFAGAALVGLGLPLVLVSELTLVQRQTPGQLQGRAIAAAEAIIDVPFAAAIATGTLIIGSVGFRPIYVCVALSFTVVGAVLLRYRSVTMPAGREQPATTRAPAEPAPQP
jgi:hypothetical protein